MTPLWIWEDNEKSGPYSDIASQHEYDHGNSTDAISAEAEALDRDDEVIWLDAPINAKESYNVAPGQEFGIWDSARDSQGVEYPRRADA